jgi:hypothetical protein
MVSKYNKQNDKNIKNVNRSKSFEKFMPKYHFEPSLETLEKKIRDFREFTNTLQEKINNEKDFFEKIKAKNKKKGICI